MSRQNLQSLKPFLSVLIIIVTLFTLVFLQMEERRMGYTLLKMSREYKKILEEKRASTIQLARLTRPQHVERVALRRSGLKRVQAQQVIHLTGGELLAQSR